MVPPIRSGTTHGGIKQTYSYGGALIAQSLHTLNRNVPSLWRAQYVGLPTS